MKVLHLISGGETGGSKNHLLSLLAQFPKEEVVLGVMQEGQLSKEAEELGLSVVHFKQTSRYDLSAIKRIATVIRKEKVDILHTHGPRANLFGYFAQRKQEVIWTTTVHSDPSKDFMKGGLKGRIFTAINMRVMKRIDHFFAVTERFKKMLIDFGLNEDQMSTIYNGISFDQLLEAKLTRKEIGLTDDDFVVIMVARLHPIKGHELAFQAVKQLKEQVPNLKLLLVGDGPMKDELKQQVKDLDIHHQVIFAGFQQDVHSYLSLADVKLLASYSESFPLVLLEAARANTPIIATDVGGVKELVHKDFGWIIPTDDVQSIKQAILKSVNDNQTTALQFMGKQLHDYARTHFSEEQLYEEVRKQYENMLE